MIKKKKLYRVYDYGELWINKKIDFLNSIWCTDNFECRNMSMSEIHGLISEHQQNGGHCQEREHESSDESGVDASGMTSHQNGHHQNRHRQNGHH